MLGLSNNGLMSVPHEIGRLANLQGLELSYNQLKSLPPELKALTRLEYLNLSNNPLPAEVMKQHQQ